jgi:UDP-N-acetylmuramyl pentapeptide synthase
LNGDDVRLHRLLEDSPTATMWFGRHADCDIAARQIDCDEKGLSFHVARQRYFVPQCGEQHLMPALITIAVGRVLDWTDSQIASGLARYQRTARAICW